MRPAATSCSSGFHTWVSARSTSLIAALPRRPSLSPSAVASGKPPAPPPTMTMRCGTVGSPAFSSITPGRPLSPRVGGAAPAAALAHNDLQAAVLVDDPRRLAQGAQPGRQRFRTSAPFDLGRPVARADIGKIDRRLRIEPAVEQSDQRLGDVIDNGGPAGRADDRGNAALRI